MTHPINSIVEHAMQLYRIVSYPSCLGCAFNNAEENHCMRPSDWQEFCSEDSRDDHETVVFINIGELAFSHSLD